MAIEVDIQVRNGVLKITVGDGQTKTGTATDQGGSGGPVVIGPIVVDGSGLQGQSGQGNFGGNGPAGPSGSVGGAGPAGPSGSVGGSGPAGPSGSVGGAGPAGPSGSVGGGPGSGGSGPSCPVVIGPIVISDCSGQATDPPTLSGAQEIAVSPPIGVHAKGLAGMFNMQTQDETEWCWAAVAVSINAYLDPPAGDGGPTWTQPSLATQVLAQELQWNPAVDCSADPSEECDRPAGLNDALSITGNLMPDGYRSNCFLDFASLQSWMDQQLPVGARILWPGGGAHFIALSGYQVFASGEQKVVVQDPLYGPSVQDYSSLRGQYICHGSWNDTYLVTP
jgi:hypothetical protein